MFFARFEGPNSNFMQDLQMFIIFVRTATLSISSNLQDMQAFKPNCFMDTFSTKWLKKKSGESSELIKNIFVNNWVVVSRV